MIRPALLFTLLVSLTACGDGKRPAPVAPPPTASSSPAVPSPADPDLPRVSTVGTAAKDLPRPAAALTIRRSGALDLDGKPVEFAALAEVLRAAAGMKGAPGSPEFASDLNLVIRADRGLPWRAAQWVAQTAAVEGISRILFGVLPTSNGEEGTFAVFLPRDRGLSPGGGMPAAPPVKVRLETDGWWDSTPLALYATLRGGAARRAQLDAAGTVATGAVLEVADLLYRAGVRELFLGGTSPPRASEALPAATREAPRCWVRLNGEPVHLPAGGQVDVPPLLRAAGIAGFAEPPEFAKRADLVPAEEDEVPPK